MMELRNSLWREAPGFCVHRNEDSGAHIKMRFLIFVGDMSLMGDADCTYDFRRLAPFVAGSARDMSS